LRTEDRYAAFKLRPLILDGPVADLVSLAVTRGRQACGIIVDSQVTVSPEKERITFHSTLALPAATRVVVDGKEILSTFANSVIVDVAQGTRGLQLIDTDTPAEEYFPPTIRVSWPAVEGAVEYEVAWEQYPYPFPSGIMPGYRDTAGTRIVADSRGEYTFVAGPFVNFDYCLVMITVRKPNGISSQVVLLFQPTTYPTPAAGTIVYDENPATPTCTVN